MAKKDREIIEDVKKGFSYSHIGNIYKISRQSVYNIVKKYLKNLSELDYKGVGGVGGYPLNRYFRVHALQLRIRIKNPSKKYQNIDFFKPYEHKGNIVICYKKAINLYIKKDFLAFDQKTAEKNFREYLKIYLRQLGRFLNTYLKETSAKIVKIHIAEVKNELSIKADQEKERVSIYQDERPWLLMDNSINIPEIETIEAARASYDMSKVITPFMNTLRVNPKILTEHESKITRAEKMIIGLSDIINNHQEAFTRLFPNLFQNTQEMPLSIVRDVPNYIG